MTAQPGAGMLNSGCSSSSVSLGKSLSRPPASAEFFVFSIFHFSWGFVRSTFQSPAELLAGIKDNRCPPRSEPAKAQRFTSTMHLHYWIHHAIVVLAWQRPQGSASLGKEMTQIRAGVNLMMLGGDSHAQDSWAKRWEGRHENCWPNDIQALLTPVACGYETLKHLDSKYHDSNCTPEMCLCKWHYI